MYLPKAYEKLEQFCKNQINEVYIARLQSEKDSICTEWQTVWTEFCAELAETGQKAEFVEISLLRHMILQENETPVFLFEAFDERWIFDGSLYREKRSLKTLTPIISAYRKAVYYETSQFYGKIPTQLGEKAFLEHLPYLETQIAGLLKESDKTWLRTSDFSPNVQCSLGGYRFFQSILYEGA